jgi:hypothetical protein
VRAAETHGLGLLDLAQDGRLDLAGRRDDESRSGESHATGYHESQGKSGNDR